MKALGVISSALRGFALVVVALSASIIAGCDGPRGHLSDIEASALTSESAVYRIAPGDKIKVTVFNEPELTGEFQVRESGTIAFPLAGEVPAAGASATEFQERLTKHLRGRYVRDPKVSVEIADYRPINVIGEVRNAGQYAYRPGLTVQDAVALAGGYTYRANTRTVYLRRRNASGEITVQTDGERVAIYPGDNVRVPERYF